jgi:hypothetical protein
MTMEGTVMGSKLRVAAISLAAAMTAFGMGVFATPASASCAQGVGCNTTATFTITGGALTITVPASTVNLGSTGTGNGITPTTFAGDLGNTTVTDARGALSAIWTVSVTSSDFKTGTAFTGTCTSDCAPQTVTAGNIIYDSLTNVLTNTSTGSGLFATATTGPLSNSTGATGGSWLGVGVNSATWNPHLLFTLAANQAAGTYTGTITQSVA